MNRVFQLIVCLMILGAGIGRAEDNGPARTISVTGTIERKVAPDYISWTVKLRDNDKNLIQAKTISDENVMAVVALQKKLQVAEGDLETGPVRVQRIYERNNRGVQGEFKHFSVYRSVTIRQRDLDRFDEFFNALVASADMEVDFSLKSSKIPEVRAEMRLEAMKVAKEKAAAMATAVGAGLGRVLTINEHGPREYGHNPFNPTANVEYRMSTDLASEKFVPGTISAEVRVYVTFELE